VGPLAGRDVAWPNKEPETDAQIAAADRSDRPADSRGQTKHADDANGREAHGHRLGGGEAGGSLVPRGVSFKASPFPCEGVGGFNRYSLAVNDPPVIVNRF